jgi:YegS/Rv2252/BmrU family lipid kinase
MSRMPELRARFQSRFVNFLVLVGTWLNAMYLKVAKRFYDAEARDARLARLSRRLALFEGGRGAAASHVLNGPDAAKLSTRKVKVFVNPISGRGVGMKAIPHLRRGFRELGFDVEVVVTDRAGQAKSGCWGLEKNVAAVVAVGGDGTLSEVINGVGDQNVPIALYPAGTGNCLAKELKIPQNPELFCRMVAEGKTIGLDVAEWTGHRRFHSFCGVGFDAKVVEELSKNRTGAIVMSAYATPIMRALKNYNWPSIRVEVDGEEITRSAGLVIVSNIKTYAVMEVSANAALDDGLLDVCVFQTRTWGAMFRYAFGAFTKTHTNDRDVIYVQGKRIKISADRPNVPVQMDGDNAGTLPVELNCIPGVVRFIVPSQASMRGSSAERAVAVAS